MSHMQQTLSHSNWRRSYVSTHLYVYMYVVYVCGVLFCSIVQSFLIRDSPSEAAVPMLSRFSVLLCSHCTHNRTALHCFALLYFPSMVIFFAVLASAQCISLAAVVRTTFRFARTTYASSIFCNPMQTTPQCSVVAQVRARQHACLSACHSDSSSSVWG